MHVARKKEAEIPSKNSSHKIKPKQKLYCPQSFIVFEHQFVFEASSDCLLTIFVPVSSS